MIKLRELQYLKAVAEYRHFGKAAEACFVSQPTLSGQLKKLEEQLGLQLIERSQHHVLLTRAGEELVRQAQVVLQAAREFEAMAGALADPLAGDLHIGMIHTVAPYVLPRVMASLVKALPSIRFFLHEGKTDDLMKQLADGELDVLVLAWLEDMQGVARFDLFDEPLVLAVPAGHPLARKSPMSLDDLHGQRVLVLEDGHCLKDQALDYCFSAGADEDTRFQATSLETLRYMVSAGAGITLLPQLAVPKSGLDEGSGIFYRPFRKPRPARRLTLLTRPHFSRQIVVEKMHRLIRQAIPELPRVSPGQEG